MFVEIDCWNQDCNHPTYVNGCGYATYYMARRVVNTDLILELPKVKSIDPTGITGGDLWCIPYADRHTYPIYTTRKMVQKLRELVKVVVL